MYTRLKSEVKRSVARLYTIYDNDLIENAITDAYLIVTEKHALPEDEMLPLWKHIAKCRLHNYTRDEYKHRLISLDSIAELRSSTKEELDEHLDRQLSKLLPIDRKFVMAVLENQIAAADDSVFGIKRAARRWFKKHISPSYSVYWRTQVRIKTALNS